MFVKRFHEFVINRKTAAGIAPRRRALLCVNQIVIDDLHCRIPDCVHITLHYSHAFKNVDGDIADSLDKIMEGMQ